jgi:vacuolar-type H+-ATPase subunit C/Vma6
MRRVEGTASLTELAHELEGTAYARFLPPRVSGAEALETGISRSLADRLETLARWAGPGGRLLTVIFLEQDVQNVRVLVRGAAGGLGSDQRLAGTIPTPALPRRALERLARADTPAAIAATLTAWAHPLGSALLTEADKGHSDPFRMEVALARRFAEEAPRASSTGGGHMRRFVAESLDGQNLVTALLLAGARSETPARDLFVEGGAALSRESFVRAAEAEDRTRAAAALAAGMRGEPLSRPLEDSLPSPAALTVGIASDRIERRRSAARLEPVSPLPVLLFVLRLREEARRLRRALWRAAVSGGAES